MHLAPLILILSCCFWNGMEISFSPNEILVNIASFLTLKDAKSLFLSSKLMYEISKTCIRTAPRLKRMLSVQSLLTLAHLPIHQLWATDLLVKDLTGEDALEEMVKMWGFIVDIETYFIKAKNGGRNRSTKQRSENAVNWSFCLLLSFLFLA